MRNNHNFKFIYLWFSRSTCYRIALFLVYVNGSILFLLLQKIVSVENYAMCIYELGGLLKLLCITDSSHLPTSHFSL